MCTFKEGKYWIEGRKSTDIIKTGGYKVSALEIERILLEHPSVSEIAVLGIQDDTFGEKICALVVPNPSTTFNQVEIQNWASQYLAKYKIPKVFKVVNQMPRNAMGKINKKLLVPQFMS